MTESCLHFFAFVVNKEGYLSKILGFYRHQLINSAKPLWYYHKKYADEVKNMKRQLPKNVRQIGNVSDSSKIYVEDYVDTFFNQLCEKAEQKPIGAFLVGEIVQEEEEDYIYVYGAIQMKDVTQKGKDIFIEESTWKNGCEICKQYFGDAEILGWFLGTTGQPLEVTHNLSKVHQKWFSREKSILVLKDVREKEEKYFVHKYKNLMESGGHYIYYEKNIEMQDYMIATRKKTGFTPSEVIEDTVTKNFRSVVREKMNKQEKKESSRYVYALSTFLVLVVMVIGVTMINNYDEMKGVQDSLHQLNETLAEDDTIEIVTDDAVETVGQIVQVDTFAELEDEKEQVEENTQENQELGIEVGDVYTVQKGDTLASISKRIYGDSSKIDAICKVNGLENGNLIYIGQKLVLP